MADTTTTTRLPACRTRRTRFGQGRGCGQRCPHRGAAVFLHEKGRRMRRPYCLRHAVTLPRHLQRGCGWSRPAPPAGWRWPEAPVARSCSRASWVIMTTETGVPRRTCARPFCSTDSMLMACWPRMPAMAAKRAGLIEHLEPQVVSADDLVDFLQRQLLQAVFPGSRAAAPGRRCPAGCCAPRPPRRRQPRCPSAWPRRRARSACCGLRRRPRWTPRCGRH